MSKVPRLVAALVLISALLAAVLLSACAETSPGGSGAEDDGADAGFRDMPRPFDDDTLGDLPNADAGDATPDDVTPGDTADDQGPSPDTGSDTAAFDTAGDVGPDLTDVTDLAGDPTAEPDAGSDANACAGVPPCAIPEVGTRCDGDVLIACRLTPDGCFAEIRVNCDAAGDLCVEADGEAECQPETPSGDGETCSTALPLTAGVHTLTTAGRVNDYNDFDACGSLLNDARGPDVVYSITLAAGATLSVSMESSDDEYDVVAAIGDACPNLTAACRAYSDESIFLYPEEVSVTNTTGSPRVYYVVADGDAATDAGPLTLTATVTGP